MKNALAYVRVSTKEQAEKGLSIPAQLKAIRGKIRYYIPWAARE
jgi:DNA invertase Pin-like site-specific DNA recombinase